MSFRDFHARRGTFILAGDSSMVLYDLNLGLMTAGEFIQIRDCP